MLLATSKEWKLDQSHIVEEVQPFVHVKSHVVMIMADQRYMKLHTGGDKNL